MLKNLLLCKTSTFKQILNKYKPHNNTPLRIDRGDHVRFKHSLSFPNDILNKSNLSTRSLAFSTNKMEEDRVGKMTSLLKEKLETDQVLVEDTSGGCGQSYRIIVSSIKFQGKPILKQHR